MISSLPKLADRAFIVGFLLPTLLFFLATICLLSDIGFFANILPAIGETEKWDKIAYLIIGLWTFSVLLQIINNAQYQMLEGYTWPLKYINFLKRREESRYDELNARVSELKKKRYQDKLRLTNNEEEELMDKWIELCQQFPGNREILLPTRFGNAILAFEHYSNEIYEADGVTLWSHLSSVIPKEFQGYIADARAQVDCLVNIVFFALILAALSIIRGLIAFYYLLDYDHANAGITIYGPKIGFFVGFSLLSALFAVSAYKLATRKVYAWGSYVKAAFDCYLPDLAEKLGFRIPIKIHDARKLWKLISIRAAMHVPFEPDPSMLAAETSGGKTSDRVSVKKHGEQPNSEDQQNGAESDAGKKNNAADPPTDG